MLTKRELKFKLEEEDVKTLQNTYALLLDILNEIELTEDPFTDITVDNEDDIINLIELCRDLSEYINKN